MVRFRHWWLGLPLVGLAVGCGLGPRHFRALGDPSPVARARAVGLDRELPDAVVIPALIGRLSDKDPVVRLSAHERLKQRTGQDFGFVPWAEPHERDQAAARWRAWWAAQPASVARPGNPRQAALVKKRRIP